VDEQQWYNDNIGYSTDTYWLYVQGLLYGSKWWDSANNSCRSIAIEHNVYIKHNVVCPVDSEHRIKLCGWDISGSRYSNMLFMSGWILLYWCYICDI
jgi:hypothetical protein